MKKNGFTLIELLAVIVILGLIALVSVSAITGTLKSYKNELYETQIENIESAARVWASDNMLLLPNGEEEVTCEYSDINNCPTDYNELVISLTDLQNGGYIDKELKNPKTKKSFDNIEIIITKNGKKMEYEVIDQTYLEYEVGDKITVQVNDTETIDFYVIEKSSSRTKNVKAIMIDSLTTDSIAWCSECTTNTNGSTTITETLNSYGWTNVTEKRLITVNEFNSVLANITNAENQTWISGDYWTSTIYGTTYAYYVNSSSEVVEDLITNTHKIRPVIKVSKTYIK